MTLLCIIISTPVGYRRVLGLDHRNSTEIKNQNNLYTCAPFIVAVCTIHGPHAVEESRWGAYKETDIAIAGSARALLSQVKRMLCPLYSHDEIRLLKWMIGTYLWPRVESICCSRVDALLVHLST